MRDDPWWVAEEVHTALSIMERLHPHKLLFCGSALRPRGSGENKRIIRTLPLNNAIARFVEWCNASATKLALPGNEIPTDSNGRITMRHFRQTIGRDIAEAEEAGENVVMALNRQFDHRAIAQTMAYMGSGDEGTSLLDEQRVLAAHDRQHARAEALTAGLTVSGAAKEPLIARVKEYVLRFPGTVLTQRELDRIRKDGRLSVHDDRNQMVRLRVRQQKGAVSQPRFQSRGRTQIRSLPIWLRQHRTRRPSHRAGSPDDCASEAGDVLRAGALAESYGG